MPFLEVLEFLLLVKRLQGLGQMVPRTCERLLRAPHARLFRFFVIYAHTVKKTKRNCIPYARSNDIAFDLFRRANDYPYFLANACVRGLEEMP